MTNIEADLIAWLGANVKHAWPGCLMHECDGTEEEGALCSFPVQSATRYFVMPDVASGDIIWWSGRDAALYLTRTGCSPRDSREAVPSDVMAAEYAGNAAVLSGVVARFDGGVLEALCSALSFSDDGRLDVSSAEAVDFGAFYESIPAFADVPAKRPPAFVTVEATGGGGDYFQGTQMVAVQSWAPSRLEASGIAIAARDAAFSLAESAGSDVTCVDAGMPYNFPSGECPRYQFVADVSAV